ncbi:MAG: 23S rRNA (adenine(2030)-N(6))-methyltransferase RlmJ [Proteobacteria bacterium]|nr:23S rRNA (adenine(2030)-N(6))-methyltransferase RlmJ [Pseudomonadota bacterium]
MNYRHAFHAGNFADVVKHLALAAVLLHLRKKDAAFAVIDSHAGRGRYDLSGAEAQRTGEAEGGIARLASLKDSGGALGEYLALASDGASYPGSPLIAAALLRPQDRLVAIEKHPEEAGQLKAALIRTPRAQVEVADGYRRFGAHLPPKERRGVVLIDPPFEASDEFEAMARAFADAYRRFATGIYLLWFPIKSAAEANAFVGEVLGAGVKKALRMDIAIDVPPSPDGKARLAAAGLIVVNPPFGFADEMRAALGQVAPLLGARCTVSELAGEGAG